jgi:hypothetical protein
MVMMMKTGIGATFRPWSTRIQPSKFSRLQTYSPTAAIARTANESADRQVVPVDPWIARRETQLRSHVRHWALVIAPLPR